MTPSRRLAALTALTALALGAPALGRLLVRDRATPFTTLGAQHLLGTDALGRDVLAQLLLTAPATFLVPALAAIILAVTGATLGILLGLAPDLLRRISLRAGDVLLIIPPIVVTLVIVLGFGASPQSLVIAVVLSGIVMFIRVLSDATRQLAHAGYVEAAIGFGDPPLRIAFRDVLPQLGGILIAETTLRFLGAIQLVAAFSFLGLATGLGDSWARAIRDNILGFPLNPWATLAPGIALVASVALVALLAGSHDTSSRRGRSA